MNRIHSKRRMRWLLDLRFTYSLAEAWIMFGRHASENIYDTWVMNTFAPLYFMCDRRSLVTIFSGYRVMIIYCQLEHIVLHHQVPAHRIGSRRPRPPSWSLMIRLRRIRCELVEAVSMIEILSIYRIRVICNLTRVIFLCYCTSMPDLEIGFPSQNVVSP